MPHELPAHGTPERVYMETAFTEIQQDRNGGSGSADQSLEGI